MWHQELRVPPEADSLSPEAPVVALEYDIPRTWGYSWDFSKPAPISFGRQNQSLIALRVNCINQFEAKMLPLR